MTPSHLRTALLLRQSLLAALRRSPCEDWPPLVAEFAAQLAQLALARDVTITILVTVAEDVRAIVAGRAHAPAVDWWDDVLRIDGSVDVSERFSSYVAALIATAHPATRDAVEAAQQYIEQHYAEALTTADVARAIGHERSYFSTLFHRQTGQTIHRYVTAVRLRHAAARIADGEKVEAAMLSAGFRSKRSFYCQFRSANGCTPAAFRRHAHDTLKSA